MAELIHGMPFSEYMKIRGLSASGLKILSRSPAHYVEAIKGPSKPSAAQALGTHVHGLLLEPDTYDYFIQPECDRRTNAGKTTYKDFIAITAERPEVNIVTSEQHDKALAMVESVRAQPYAAALLADGKPEVTALWEIDGIKCKARFDWLPSGHEVIVDLKTAQDASQEEFARSAGRYRYHYQAAFYSRASDACGIGPRPMIFIVVENEPPFGVALYTLDEEAVYAANFRIERLIEQYAECKRSGDWPAYPIEVETLSLPKWSL